ncbi:hypothetical protein ALC56_14042 [Trachymyrmex septentrionalis]|uniref:Uncharacterized protein n=1 Tax=Trachymyrmex septentrionalis TaxID=34720 RepID=A0A151JT91_9HYME|nr:hypothetical protein ALC56_14042 [Trachymyrmex septentrionalis]
MAGAPKRNLIVVEWTRSRTLRAPPRYPRRRARAERRPGIAMAPISSMRDASRRPRKGTSQIRDVISREKSRRKDGHRVV